VIRQKLFASDLAVLDGLINYVIQYKIGDKDHPPVAPTYDPKTGNLIQEGTIAMVRRMVQQGRTGPAIELFLPYYVTMEILTQKPETLLSEVKYVQSSLEIFNAFGIFFARSTAGSRERMERINISNFEEMMGAIRARLRAFWEMMAAHIVALNGDKLKSVPSWSPFPLNTKNDKFLDQLMGLKKIGSLSTRTLLRYQGLDDAVELGRIASEQGAELNDMLNENVPTSFVQQTVGKPGQPGTPKKTAISPTRQPGRPRGTGTPKTPKNPNA
jgi:hypothetical protein